MATLTTEKGELKTRLDSSIDENKSGNYGAALGLEVGVGLATDWATAPLLAAPVPGARPLYYGINYAVGAGTNILAQKIRGEDETNWGEVTAAGGFQTIPFGTTAKGWKGVRRAMGKGAAIGVGGEQVRVGIDEQRLLTPEEIAVSGTIGAGLGGTIKLGTESADILIKQRRDNILKRKQRPSYTRPGSENMPIDRSDVFEADDLSYGRGPQKKTYTQTHPRQYYPDPKSIPDDPWGSPTDKLTDIAKLKDIARRHDMKMSLFKSIGVDDFEPFVPDFDEFLAIKKGLPIVADANVTASHAKKLKKLKLGNLGSVFHREELTRVSKKTGLGQLTRREAQTISNESVKHFTKRAPERVGMIDELRSFYSNLTESQIIPELDHKNPLKLSAYLMDGQDLAGRRNIRKIIYNESGLYTGDDVRNFQALPREVHKIWTRNMNRVMGVELEKFIAEMVKKGITDRTKIAKIYAKRIREQRNKFDKAYEAHKITHGVRRNPITGQDIVNKPEDIEKVLSALADIDIEAWGPVRIRDFSRQALGDYNIRDPYRTKDLGDEAIRKKMQDTYEKILALNQELDNPKLKLSDTQITGKIKLLEKLNKKFKKLEDKLF